MTTRLTLLAAALALFGATLPAGAQEADFTRKTVTIYIGNTAGGTYDLVGRLVARHLGKHLPGNPTVIAENMPGAGTLRAANYMYSIAPKDGTALGLVSETVATEQALKNSAVQFDARKFTWIGRVAASNAVQVVWHTAKAQSIEEAKKYEITAAGTGPGNLAEIVPTLLNAIVGTKFRIVRGYPAANEALLAMERGEVDSAVPNWTTMKTAKAEWLRDKKAKVMLQVQAKRGPELPDVPALGEFGETPEGKQIIGLYANTGAIGRSFFGPPGLSEPVTKTLREGLLAMTKDPEFLSDAKRMDVDLDIGTGEEVAEAVAQTLDVPPNVITRARQIFGREK